MKSSLYLVTNSHLLSFSSSVSRVPTLTACSPMSIPNSSTPLLPPRTFFPGPKLLWRSGAILGQCHSSITVIILFLTVCLLLIMSLDNLYLWRPLWYCLIKLNPDIQLLSGWWRVRSGHTVWRRKKASPQTALLLSKPQQIMQWVDLISTQILDASVAYEM